MVNKIVSGGQTRADRAALDVAIEMGISHDCPLKQSQILLMGLSPFLHSHFDVAVSGFEKGVHLII
ncbi:MAG: hypothetical protein JRI45_12245 [Deltaproteobacteria bacterium]|nr:hypothetical protein [Deltaproteobacteria bacterium]